jgi:hypothetical protein
MQATKTSSRYLVIPKNGILRVHLSGPGHGILEKTTIFHIDAVASLAQTSPTTCVYLSIYNNFKEIFRCSCLLLLVVSSGSGCTL